MRQRQDAGEAAGGIDWNRVPQDRHLRTKADVRDQAALGIACGTGGEEDGRELLARLIPRGVGPVAWAWLRPLSQLDGPQPRGLLSIPANTSRGSTSSRICGYGEQ